MGAAAKHSAYRRAGFDARDDVRLDLVASRVPAFLAASQEHRDCVEVDQALLQESHPSLLGA